MEHRGSGGVWNECYHALRVAFGASSRGGFYDDYFFNEHFQSAPAEDVDVWWTVQAPEYFLWLLFA